MTITHCYQENRIVFHIKGKIDTITAPLFEEYLQAHLDFEIGDIVFNLFEVEYIASSGLRLLLIAAKKAKVAERKVILQQVNATVLQVLAVSGFTSLFEMERQHGCFTT